MVVQTNLKRFTISSYVPSVNINKHIFKIIIVEWMGVSGKFYDSFETIWNVSNFNYKKGAYEFHMTTMYSNDNII